MDGDFIHWGRTSRLRRELTVYPVPTDCVEHGWTTLITIYLLRLNNMRVGGPHSSSGIVLTKDKANANGRHQRENGVEG